MNDLERIDKLLNKLQEMIERLENNHSVLVHHKVSQFYYMQKSSELQMLRDEMKILLEKEVALARLLTIIYPEVFNQWRSDLRWLSNHARARKNKAML